MPRIDVIRPSKPRTPLWWPKIALSVGIVGGVSVIGVWRAYYYEPMPPDLERSVRQMVDLKTDLKPMLDKALEDGVLTMPEGRAIVDAFEKEIGQ